MTAVMSRGTIPDTGDYSVILEPQAISIGTVNEDFAIESIAGDIFQLGNTSYLILRVEPGRVRVEDAQGLPPSIRSGSARRPAAATSCRWACRGCARRSPRGSAALRASEKQRQRSCQRWLKAARRM